MNNIKNSMHKISFTLLVIIIAVFCLFPFFWMFFNAFKPAIDIRAYPPVWTFKPTLNNFIKVFIEQPFFNYFMNSMIIATFSTIIGVLLSLPAAYSIARYKQGFISLILLTARMLPGMVYLIPLFIIYNRLGLIDTYLSLIITYLIISVPLSTWLLIPYFEDIPSDLECAGMIDGCSKIGVFFRINLPLALPGIAVVTILSFVYCWNDFIFVLILGGVKTQTLPLAAYHFMTYGSMNWGSIFAAATIITLPIAIISLFLQRYLISGLTSGGLKD